MAASLWLATSAALALTTAASALGPEDGKTTFASVAPLFLEHCAICHGGDDPAAALSLESLEALKKGGESGPAAVAGDPARSEIVLRLRGKKKPRMPLDADPLGEADIALVEKFVADGLLAAPDPSALPAPPKPRALPKPGEPVAFADVEPLFKKNCVRCHMPDGERGDPPEGYRLDSWEASLAPGERVRIVPGTPRASELVRRLRGLSRPAMPLGGEPLTPDEIRVVEDWVAAGAPGPAGGKAPIPAGAEVRFRGKLTARYAIDGLPLVVDRGTRIDKEPAVGAEAEVRGTVLPDGRIRATRLRRR